jgi:hypothetical protein
MPKSYWGIIADEIADLGWCCDYCPVETPGIGVLISAYADKGDHHLFAQADTKLNAFMELKAMVVEHEKEMDGHT